MNLESNKDLISVIIPTHNRAKLVSRAIDSVLAQTYRNYEIIVVDDGSTDNTRQILSAFGDRISYIYQENAGVSAARNSGIKRAKGQKIAFLDSDDIWLPHKLERQIQVLEKSQAKVCYTNILWNSNKENILLEKSIPLRSSVDSARVFNEPFEFLFFSSDSTALSTLMVERDLLRKVGCFDERMNYHEDVRLCLQLAFESPFAYINEPLVVFDRCVGRQRVSVNHSGNLEANCGDAITRAEAYLRSPNKNKRIVKELRRQLGHYLSVMAFYACTENNGRAARRFALDGLYFGARWRTYRRCLGVLLCPWLVKRMRRIER